MENIQVVRLSHIERIRRIASKWLVDPGSEATQSMNEILAVLLEPEPLLMVLPELKVDLEDLERLHGVIRQLEERWDREVLGLNNEGDPIGGDPAGGMKNQIEQLLRELAPHRTVQLADSRRDRAYLAGPMTGYEDFNFPAFNAEADRLRAMGIKVVNPAEHGIVDGAQWGDYLRYDIAKLAQCEWIHFLPGWQDSKGAKLEHSIAKALGMPMTFAEGAQQEPAELYSSADEARMDVIGQNGPTGEHYAELAEEAIQNGGKPVAELPRLDTEDDEACEDAFHNEYHKVPAPIGRIEWDKRWKQGMAPPQLRAQGWIEWHADRCLARPENVAAVMFRNGSVSTNTVALNWSPMSDSFRHHEIVAYRVAAQDAATSRDTTQA